MPKIRDIRCLLTIHDWEALYQRPSMIHRCRRCNWTRIKRLPDDICDSLDRSLKSLSETYVPGQPVNITRRDLDEALSEIAAMKESLRRCDTTRT